MGEYFVWDVFDLFEARFVCDPIWFASSISLNSLSGGWFCIFFSSLNLFISYKENPIPQADTKRIIKTGVFAYCRNPMYLAFTHICLNK